MLVFALFAGIGVFAYLAAWLLLPDDADADPRRFRVVDGGPRLWIGGLLALIVASSAFPVAAFGGSSVLLAMATVGIGAGQMSRLDSSRIAARKAVDAAEASGASEPLTIGSVVASDAFFPFADGLLAAAEAGATAVIQPGGSMRDEEVIAAADEAGLAMVFTGVRHFRH